MDPVDRILDLELDAKRMRQELAELRAAIETQAKVIAVLEFERALAKI